MAFFVSLPTGSKASPICFALLALVFDSDRRDTGSIVLCISPLKAIAREHAPYHRKSEARNCEVLVYAYDFSAKT